MILFVAPQATQLTILPAPNLTFHAVSGKVIRLQVIQRHEIIAHCQRHVHLDFIIDGKTLGITTGRTRNLDDPAVDIDALMRYYTREALGPVRLLKDELGQCKKICSPT